MNVRARTHWTTAWAMLLALIAATAAGASDFRGLSWGASKAEVRRVEKHPLHHDLENELAYWNFELGGVAAGLVYTFEEGKLIRAHFVSRSPEGDAAGKLADFRVWKALFDEHFGSPSEEEWIWADGVERGEGERVLDSLTSGLAKAVARWEVGHTAVELVIAGGEGRIQTVRAVYQPK